VTLKTLLELCRDKTSGFLSREAILCEVTIQATLPMMYPANARPQFLPRKE
jgi:hypothetical protein